MWWSIFGKIFLAQFIVACIIVFVLKKILDCQLISSTIQKFELLKTVEDLQQVAQVEVISCENLNKKEISRINAAASNVFGANVDVVFRINKSMWGGVIIKYGDGIFDGSTKNRIKSAF